MIADTEAENAGSTATVNVVVVGSAVAGCDVRGDVAAALVLVVVARRVVPRVAVLALEAGAVMRVDDRVDDRVGVARSAPEVSQPVATTTVVETTSASTIDRPGPRTTSS